jgi:hypothetical protein
VVSQGCVVWPGDLSVGFECFCRDFGMLLRVVGLFLPLHLPLAHECSSFWGWGLALQSVTSRQFPA